MRYYAIVRHVLKPQKPKRNHRNERSDRNDQTEITKTNETTKTRWPKLAKPNHQNKQKHRNDGNKGLNLLSFSFSGFVSLFGVLVQAPLFLSATQPASKIVVSHTQISYNLRFKFIKFDLQKG